MLKLTTNEIKFVSFSLPKALEGFSGSYGKNKAESTLYNLEANFESTSEAIIMDVFGMS